MIVGLLEGKQSREGRTVMSPFVASIRISRISLILDPRRLLRLVRGSSEDRFFSNIQGLWIWPLFDIIWTPFSILTMYSKSGGIEMETFYF